MNNIFEKLRESHQKQRMLMDELLKTSGDSQNRRSLYSDLKHELEQHAIAEERCFYAPLIKEDNTVELSRHGIAEHHEIDKIIEQLDETEFSSTGWLTVMKSLQHKVSHHLSEKNIDSFKWLVKYLLNNKSKVSLNNTPRRWQVKLSFVNQADACLNAGSYC